MARLPLEVCSFLLLLGTGVQRKFAVFPATRGRRGQEA